MRQVYMPIGWFVCHVRKIWFLMFCRFCCCSPATDVLFTLRPVYFLPCNRRTFSPATDVLSPLQPTYFFLCDWCPSPMYLFPCDHCNVLPSLAYATSCLCGCSGYSWMMSSGDALKVLFRKFLKFLTVSWTSLELSQSLWILSLATMHRCSLMFFWFPLSFIVAIGM